MTDDHINSFSTIWTLQYLEHYHSFNVIFLNYFISSLYNYLLVVVCFYLCENHVPVLI